ncbi:YceI family protein [Thalassobius sp. I31.1]|uniref:YceI family protein n=1 Tax=Thalassobius sp. I31.1 TaxID=2109912 RepID=UPI00130081FF|nr:YceI family protein [Thalassobius sp. I31.1]
MSLLSDGMHRNSGTVLCVAIVDRRATYCDMIYTLRKKASAVVRVARLLSFAGMLFSLTAVPGVAENQPYRIVSSGRADFSYQLAGREMQGYIPIQSAALLLDLDAPEQAIVQVSFNVSGSRAGNFLATSALRERKVLDTDAYPTARFESRRVQKVTDGVRMEGDFMLRGVIQPLELTVSLLRDGRNSGETSVLNIRGSFDRRAFGATGYPDLVDPLIKLDFNIEIVPVT